ncbi:MAG: LysR family transcriptional regulator [Burkholderiaceae bacterium]
MNTKFLETLVVLSRVGSFRETAQVMTTTQAAISQRIAALESELGAALVERSARGVTLTPIGEQVVRQSERILALERELRECATPGAPVAGRVRIGTIESIVRTWLSPLIRELGERYPLVLPDITVAPAQDLQDLLRQRKLDVLIQNDPFTEAAGNLDFQQQPLCEFPICWIARPELLPDDRSLQIADLEKRPLLTFSRTSSPHAHVRALFIDRPVEPRVCSVPSVESIIQLVCDGYGIAAIPPVFVRSQLEQGLLRQADGPPLPPMIVTVINARQTGAAVDVTQQLVREVAAAYCERVGETWARSLDADPD